MIRISNAQGSYSIVQKMVSENIAHNIKLCLGKADDAGNLTDTKRAADFMRNVWYLKPLIGQQAKIGDGILEKEFPWEEALLCRYSDILAKLEDTKHEYAFDEFGQGLIFAIAEIRHTGSLEYLHEYGEDPYAPEHELVEFMEGGEEEYNALMEAVTKNAPEYLKEVLDDEYDEVKGYLEEKGISMDVLYKAYGKMYALTVLNVSSYLEDGMKDEPMELAMAGSDLSENDKNYLKKQMRYLYMSPILDGYDYEIIMESLSKKDSLDISLKTGLTLAGFTLSNYAEIFTGKDQTYDIK